MTILPSPDTFLPDGALEIIRAHAATAGQQRDLAPEVLDLIYREGWFRLLVPPKWGGRGLALPQLVRLEEGLAYADGSLGWVVTLCSGAGWFGGFLPSEPVDTAPMPPSDPLAGSPGPPSDAAGPTSLSPRSPTGLIASIFTNPRLCIAGSGSPTGDAHLLDGAYRVSGNWAYASGIRHATAYTANCVIGKDGAPLRDGNGQPIIKAFLFLPGEVQIRNDWNAMGLVATGSHGFSVNNSIVGPERVFVIDATAATDDHPLYQYPFLPLAEATLAANLSGMGWHFLDCCAEYFQRRPMPEAASLLERARTELSAARGEFYRALDHSWEVLRQHSTHPDPFQAVTGTDPFKAVSASASFEAVTVPNSFKAVTHPGPFEAVSKSSHQLAAKVRDWAHRLYPYAGLGATRLDTTINRVWRDLNTAAQHPVLVFQRSSSVDSGG